jgi:hypothetical protein
MVVRMLWSDVADHILGPLSLTRTSTVRRKKLLTTVSAVLGAGLDS